MRPNIGVCMLITQFPLKIGLAFNNLLAEEPSEESAAHLSSIKQIQMVSGGLKTPEKF